MRATVILRAILGIVFLFGNVLSFAASLWTDVDATRIAARGERFAPPDKARTMALDYRAMTELLRAAPLEKDVAAPDSTFEIELPLPEGGFSRFRVVESPVMAPELAARYPMLKTYLGQGIDNPTTTVRFDLTARGFRAQVIANTHTTYIEPYQRDDVGSYLVFNKFDYAPSRKPYVCNVTGTQVKSVPNLLRKNSVAALASGANLRTYRLALATTGEYTEALGGTKLDGLSGVITTVNRVNGIYERELSVRMTLIANNDLLIYTDGATDPYTNDDGFVMLDENQSSLTATIGSANYDIGHVFSTGGGGVASLGSVCSATAKARGVTGLSNPTGDSYDVDFVAHEMGHQFAGNHTFNGSGNNCSGQNRNAATAYEPGSGVTIQAYAGICGADNLQRNSEDHFHRISLDEMLGFTTNASTGASCGLSTSTGNTPPTVTTAAAFTIPRSTPFTLTAVGSDANGDALTYTWEQFNLGAANTAGVLTDTGSGPLFRSFAPSTDPKRTFPSLRYILSNANVAPATAPLPGTTTPNFMTGELLPSTNRTMNFRVTVRDNRAGGGGTNDAATAITVNNAAGPFAVTAPNTNVTWAAGSSQTITWSVANTNAAPINTANVEIALSLDGGYTFPVILAASTPNDGSETLTIPAGTSPTTQARIRISAVGNIYFDISDANFTITGTNTAPTLSVTGSVTTSQGAPATTAVVATVSDAQDAAGSLAVSVSGVPPELSVTATNNGGNVSLAATASCSLVAPTGGSKAFPVLLTVTDSAGASTTLPVNVLVTTNAVPTLGEYSNVFLTRGLSIVVAPNAAIADANNNLIAASVSPAQLPGSGAGVNVTIAANGTVTVNSDSSTTLGARTIRAQANDVCGAVQAREFTVTVIPPGPFLRLSSSDLITGNARIEPNECNELNVSVNNVGNAAASIVSAALSSTTSGVNITRPNSTLADIAAGDTRSTLTPFQISTTNALACGSNANFNVTVNYTGGNSPAVFPLSFLVGASSNVFTQNFDGVTAPALPAGWTTVQTGAAPAGWASTTTGADSAPNAVFTNGVATVSTNSLITPPIALPASTTSATLTFRHAWNFEGGFDGGVLEVSTDGGTNYNDVTSVGGVFTTGGYVATLPTLYQNPLGTRAVWTGLQSSYITTTLQLPASLNGQTIRLRFRGGWDNDVGVAGPNWRIDGVNVQSGLTCPGPGSGVCSAPAYSIGGTVSGLVGTGLVLQNNGGNNLSISADGNFAFTTTLASGSAYAVSVLTQPSSPNQTCTVGNGSGAVGSANVTNISVNCTASSFAVTTNVAPLGAGSASCTPNPVPAGGNATCSATANLGFAFANWSGDCTGATCALNNVTSAKAVTANFVALPILNIDDSDAPDVYDARTDGLLLTRYLLGMRGTTLTDNALGTNARRNAAQIEAHIATYLARFDVDGDGNTLPTTDAALIVRRLLGLSGAALTSGVRNGSRSDADIANAIDAMKP